MIRASYSHGGKVHRLTIDGHAGYAPQGSDIVCAGVSALAYALVGYLEGVDGSFFNSQPGHLVIECKNGKHVHTAFEVTVTGIRQLADAYPDNVTFDMPNGG